MNKMILAVLLSLAVSVSAFAMDGSSGCGMGWYVTQKNSLLSSSIRASTNATFFNTVAMTFGTSNCQKHDIVKNEKIELHYAEANLENLSVDMAIGDGEYLRGLAFIMGCDDASYGSFSSQSQSHYSEIFGGEKVSPAEFLQRVKTVTHGCAVTG